MDSLGTLITTQVGFDFTGVAQNATLRQSNGVDLYDGCTLAGMIAFPTDWFTRINLISMKLDGAIHGAAGSSANLILVINGRQHVLDNITNETSYVYRGGPMIVPPGSMLIVNFAPAAVPVETQQFMVMYEKYRIVHPTLGIM